MAGDASVHWYALKVFFNRVFEIEELLKKDLKESYIPCQTINVVSNGIRKNDYPFIDVFPLHGAICK